MSEDKKLKKLALVKVPALKTSKDSRLRLTVDGGEYGKGFFLVKVPLKKKPPVREYLMVVYVAKDEVNVYFVCEKR